MQESISLQSLRNPKPHSSYISSRHSGSPVFIRSNTPQVDASWKIYEKSKNLDPKRISQYTDSRQVDRDSYNTNFSSRKRIILKNKHKFPSDFFNSTQIQSNYQESFDKRQKNRIDSLCPKLLIPKVLRNSESDLQMFGIPSSNIHETPKFISDEAPQSGEAQLLQNKVRNGLAVHKDHLKVPNDSIDLVKKLDSSRTQSALLPNARIIGNISERILGKPLIQEGKPDNIIKSSFITENVKLVSNEILGEKSKTLSRLSSQEFLQKFSQEHHSKSKVESTDKDELTPENKTRAIILKNKLLEDLILIRKKSISLTSNGSQSALPTIRNASEGLENLPYMKIKLEGVDDKSLKQDNKETKHSDYRLRSSENDDKKSSNDNSPLPYLIKRSEVLFFGNCTKSHETISPLQPSLIQSTKVISYDDIRLNKNSQDHESEFELDEKSGECKKEKDIGAHFNQKAIVHRRHASMDFDNFTRKYDQLDKKTKNSSHTEIMKRRAVQSVIKQRISSNYLNHLSVDLKKNIEIKDEIKEENKPKIEIGIENRKSVANSIIDSKEIKLKSTFIKEIKEITSNEDLKFKKVQAEINEQTDNLKEISPLPKNHQLFENNSPQIIRNGHTRQRGFTFGKDERKQERSHPLQVINTKSNILTIQKEINKNSISINNKSFKSTLQEAKSIPQKVEIIKNQKDERNTILRLIKH